MKGELDEAIQANLKALEISPEFAVVHNNLAIAYLQAGDPQSAIEHCDRAVALGYEVAPEILAELAPHREA